MYEFDIPAFSLGESSSDTDTDESERWSVIIRPPEESDADPREAAEQLFAGLHTHGRIAYEIHSDGANVEIHLGAGDEASARAIARQVRSEIEARTTVKPASMPIDEDDPLSAATFDIEMDVIYPIETAQTAENGVSSLRHVLDTMAEDDVHGVYQVVVEPVIGGWSARHARAYPASIQQERDIEQELKRAGVAMLPVAALSVVLSPWPIATTLCAALGLLIAATVGEGVRLPRRRAAEDIASEHREQAKDAHGARSSVAKRAKETADVMIEQGSALGWQASVRLVVAGENRMLATDHRDRLVSQVSASMSSTTTGQEFTATTATGRDAHDILEQVRRRDLDDRQPREIMRQLLAQGTRKKFHVGPGEFASLANFPDADGGGERARGFTAGSALSATALPSSAPAFAMPAIADGGTATDYLLDAPTAVERGRHDDLGDVDIKVTDDGDYYAGEWLRSVVENATRDSNIVLGSTEGDDADTVREVAVDGDQLDQHMFIVGASGAGKSTLAEYVVQQHAHAGRGMCIIDPHNEFVDGIRRRLPEHRTDDVILIDPEGAHDRTVTINFLDVELDPDHPEYESAVNAAVSDLVGVLRQGTSNVGDRMEDAVRTVARGMILSEQDYTLLDMQQLMTDPEQRTAFATRMHSEDRDHIARAAEGIAELSNDDLAPVARLFNEWVMSPVSRQIIEQTESSFSFAEAVANDRIILFRGDLSDDNLARQYATTVYRGVMRACEDRDAAGRERTFAVIIDEADDIYTPEMKLGDDLGNARKYGASLTLMTQLPKRLSEIQDELETNCKTFISFACPSKKQARPIASMYGCDTADIQGLGDYVAQVQIDVDGERSGPYRTDSPAPIPPVREEETAVADIDMPSLDRFGVDPTDTTTQEEIEADGGHEEPDPIEAFLLEAADAVDAGVIEKGEHYTFVYEDTPRERLRINPSKSIDALDAEGIDHPRFGEINDHSREAVENDDMAVVDHGQYTPDIGNCLGVDLDRVDHPRIDVEAGDF